MQQSPVNESSPPEPSATNLAVVVAMKLGAPLLCELEKDSTAPDAAPQGSPPPSDP